MATISKVSALIDGIQRTVDLSTNTLAVENLEVNGTLLSQTGVFALFSGIIPGASTSVSIVANWAGIAGNSIALAFSGSNTIASAISTWNLAHPTNACSLTSGDGTQIPSVQTLNLAGGSDAGSSLVGDTATYQNFTPTSATVAGALAGIDRALSNVSGGSQKVEIYTLNSTDITNKFITLTATPSVAAKTILLVENAGSMFYGEDFIVSGNQLSWSGLALDGILAAGDNLTISYPT